MEKLKTFSMQTLLENGASRLAKCSGTTDLQFVKHTMSVKYTKETACNKVCCNNRMYQKQKYF